jgi:hypothetical protein
MSRKPRSAPDPEVRRKVVVAIHRDLERDYENALQGPEKLEMLERVLLKARSDQPNHRPIERELFLAYLCRLRRYNFPPAADGGSAPAASLAARENYWRERRDECEQVSKEIRELAGLIWGEQAVFRRMIELSDKIWSDEFWSGLRKLDVAPRDILGTIDSLIPPALGRPITKQPLAVKALQSKLARNLSWPQVTRQVCDCGNLTHGPLCQDRLKKEVKAVERILSKYGIHVPSRQHQHPHCGEKPSPFPPRKK